jgi:hypothetical protein
VAWYVHYTVSWQCTIGNRLAQPLVCVVAFRTWFGLGVFQPLGTHGGCSRVWFLSVVAGNEDRFDSMIYGFPHPIGTGWGLGLTFEHQVMNNWRKQLNFDPLPRLLSSANAALVYWVRRDLLEEQVSAVDCLWQLPEAQKILKKQQPDGSWVRLGEKKHPAINYALVETWRQFRFLVEQYGFSRGYPQASLAAEFLFSCQTPVGDFRGILANQYATYYTGAILASLIQADYADDPRIDRGFKWLLAMRQSDGGWTIPMLTHKLDRATQYRSTTQYVDPVEPDRSKPFSHNWTGMILRAFAAHPGYRKSPAAQTAAALLKSRFFKQDVYASYQAASYWVRFEYPFWWNNLVAALDSLSLIGLPKEDKEIRLGLDWLREHQTRSGLWRVSYVNPRAQEKDTVKVREMKLWVTLAICRVFKRFYG